MKPWITCTREQANALINTSRRLGVNLDHSPILNNTWLNTISHTLRYSYNDLNNYLRGYHNFKYIPYLENYRTDQIERLGKFEKLIIDLLTTFSPEIEKVLRGFNRILDRRNADDHDPLQINDNYPLSFCYIPKNITNFEAPNKTLALEISYKIQRGILKANTQAENCPESDKTVTIKCFTNSNKKYLHVYFNKRSPWTLRELFYRSFREACILFNLPETIKDEEDKNLFIIIFNAFFKFNNDTEHDAATVILEALQTYLTKKIQFEQDNLIEIFAKNKQTAMNSYRYDCLKQNLDSVRRNLENNVQSYTRLSNDYRQAAKAVSEFSEVEFTAMTVFLNKIKDNPNTKFLAKINSKQLQFLLEEPLIHTDEHTWAKYLANKDSTVNIKIRNYAHYNKNYFNTKEEILIFAIQRFIKEVLVDQKIKLFTAALLGLDQTERDFNIKKYEINDMDYFPHPHIGGNSLTCWSTAQREITKAIMEDDGETAYLQLIYAMQQMTASDNAVTGLLIEYILDKTYQIRPYYLRKDKTERENFDQIIKEFVKDETDKINAIIDSES